MYVYSKEMKRQIEIIVMCFVFFLSFEVLSDVEWVIFKILLLIVIFFYCILYLFLFNLIMCFLMCIFFFSVSKNEVQL